MKNTTGKTGRHRNSNRDHRRDSASKSPQRQHHGSPKKKDALRRRRRRKSPRRSRSPFRGIRHRCRSRSPFEQKMKQKAAEICETLVKEAGLRVTFSRSIEKEVEKITAAEASAIPEILRRCHREGGKLGETAAVPTPTEFSSNYKDLTSRAYITIDNDTSMDLDQAMWLSRVKQGEKKATSSKKSTGDARDGKKIGDSRETNGDYDGAVNDDKYHRIRYLVSYALADGAFFVSPTSPLFNEALRRGGTSFYLPGLCVPMLPRKLSEDIMSLNEGQVRRALVFEIYLDEEGSVVIYKRVERHVRQIFRLLLLSGIRSGKLPAVSIDKKGFLAFTEPSRDSSKPPSSFRTRLDSERYNEQISLLCNSEGGKLLSDLAKGGGQRNNNPGPSVVQAIFRTQKGPSEDGIRTLAATILETIRAHKLPQDVWAWDSKKEFLSDYLGRLQRLCKVGADADEDAKSHKTVLASIERQAMLGRGGRPFLPPPGSLCALFLANARIDWGDCERYAVCADIYGYDVLRRLHKHTRCFSHKELKEGLLGRELPGSSVKADKRAREKIIKAASRSKKTQKSISGLVFKHAMDRLFFPELRKPRAECRIFDGYVIGMDFSGWQKSERMYIKLLAPAIQVKIYVQDLNAEHRCKISTPNAF
eukprot:jgi/Bigna1/80387/fgenesh1_pg.70_\